MRTKVAPMRVLDFDIENRPLTYWYKDMPTAEITAIAACWVGEPSSMKCWLLGRDDPDDMLAEVAQLITNADMVTGHYIRRHDLGIINAHLVEFDHPPLGSVLASDTKLDLVRYHALPASQEELSLMMGVKENKFHMTQQRWRQANRLTPEGLALTEKRVVGDVIQHMAMRRELVNRGLLGPPKVWKGDR